MVQVKQRGGGHFLALVSFLAPPKPVFQFAPKPNGNACYAGYLILSTNYRCLTKLPIFFYSLLLLTHLRSQLHNSIVLNLALTNTQRRFSTSYNSSWLLTNKNIFISLFSSCKFVFLVRFIIQWK